MKITTVLSPLAVLLLAIPVSAQEPAVPDFLESIPDVTLEKKREINGQEAFSLKTALSSEEFSTTLSKFLGVGWRKRVFSREEMGSVASMGLTSNAEVNLSVYENAKVPGVDLRVMHVEYKEGDSDSRVEILVLRSGAIVRSFGSSMSPDGTRRLEVNRRDKDLVDFEVYDSASGKKLAGDSIGWSAMRWFLHWETSSRLWGYGSDIQYFKLFEFKPDGTVENTEVDETMPVPSAVWDNLPSSLQKKYTADQSGGPDKELRSPASTDERSEGAQTR